MNGQRNNETVPDILWRKSEPNGDLRENCAGLDMYGTEFVDLFCGKKLCGICDINHTPIFTLRGSVFRSLYFLVNYFGDSRLSDYEM